MREINKIIIHCSDSEWGDSVVIDEWHRGRGWDEIGYHFVILNGHRHTSKNYDENSDGVVEEGRALEKTGAHCYGHNRDSIGICLVGKSKFTARQLYEALPLLLGELMSKYNIGVDNIYGHNDFNKSKTCPNFEINLLKGVL